MSSAYNHGWRRRALVVDFISGSATGTDFVVWKHGDKPGPWVYIVSAIGSGRIKIGFTAGTLLERMRSFETGCPFPTQALALIPGDRDLEQDLHAAFASHRQHLEWFEDSTEVRTMLAELAVKLGGHLCHEMIALANPSDTERVRAAFAKDRERIAKESRKAVHIRACKSKR